jgi:hypothetical protein
MRSSHGCAIDWIVTKTNSVRQWDRGHFVELMSKMESWHAKCSTSQRK